VIKRVIEEHQVHGLVIEAVVLKKALHLGANSTPVAKIFVETWVFLLLVGWVRLGVVSEENWVAKSFLLNILEVLLNETVNDTINDQVLVSFVQETIGEDTDGLIAPHADQLGLVGDLVLGGHKETLVDTRQVTQVEM
jgi:hypothetical protein